MAFPLLVGKRKEAVVVLGVEGRVDGRARRIAYDAVSALGLVLASRRAIAEAQRRVAEDVIADALEGVIPQSVLARRLEVLGFDAQVPATAVVVQPAGGEAGDELAWVMDLTLRTRAVARSAVLDSGIVVALVQAEDPARLGVMLAEELEGAGYEVRIGIGRPTSPASLHDSYAAATSALRASPDRKLVQAQPSSSFGVLLQACPPPVLDGFVQSVLGSLLDSPRGRSLIDSLEAYVRAGGRWETAAKELGVHRHTLRYRIKAAEELLQRDLSRAEDRLEILVALEALKAKASTPA